MKASTLRIKEVIQNDRLLRVPYFQRRYVWEREQWERFANDMESTLESDSHYFLGAIILKDEKVTKEEERAGIGSKQLVVDGQQRLTTLSIYMKVLHMLTSKANTFENQYLQPTDVKNPVIIHSCEDMPQFTEIMHMDVLKNIEGDSNIVEAYNFFLNHLVKRRDAGINLNELLNTINASITFVVISLSSDDDEQQIFDTINSLGVPLTTGELIKNFLFESNDEIAYREGWKQVFDIDEAKNFWESDASMSRQAKSKANTILERFFHAFVRVKMWDFKDKLNVYQKKSFVKSENVFTTCKAFVEVFGMNKQDLANEILEYAKLYRKYLNESILDERIPQHAGISRLSCLINASKTYTAMPYVLYILRNVRDEQERNKIFGYLENYLIRRIFTKSSNNNYSDMFSENLIGQRKNSYNELIKYISEKHDSALDMPNNKDVKFGLNNNKFDENTARLVLYLYETKLENTSNSKFKGGFNDYVAEQFMPKPCSAANENWPVHEDQYEESQRKVLIGTMGNYFLLDVTNEKIFKNCHNEPFEKKVELLKDWSRNIRSGNLLGQCHSWNEQTITNRNNVFANGFNEQIWPLV